MSVKFAMFDAEICSKHTSNNRLGQENAALQAQHKQATHLIFPISEEIASVYFTNVVANRITFEPKTKLFIFQKIQRHSGLVCAFRNPILRGIPTQQSCFLNCKCNIFANKNDTKCSKIFLLQRLVEFKSQREMIGRRCIYQIQTF